jgi:CHASE3 domain sensor protein
VSIVTLERTGVSAGHRHGYFRELGQPALFGAVVLLFSATLLLGTNISAMRGNMVWIAHTQKVLQQISLLESSLAGEQLTVRSYALTGDKRFLAYQKKSRANVVGALDELTRQTAVDPFAAERMKRIRTAVAAHLNQFGSLSGTGPDRAVLVAAAILDPARRAVVRRARTEVASFRAGEVHLLGDRQDVLTQQLSHAFFLAVGIIVAAFLLGGLGLVAVQFHSPGKRHAGTWDATPYGPAGVLQQYKHGILRDLGMPALFGAGVLLISATLLLGIDIAAMRGSLVSIGHSQQILLAVADAEAGELGHQLTVRGYALTGDASFLRYQKMEHDKLDHALDRLTVLMQTDPAGAARIRSIRSLMRKHMANYAGISGFGPDKAGIVAKAINDDKKRAVMFETRGALASYRADKVRTLGERQDYLTRQLSQSFELALGIIVAAFLLGGLGLMAAQLRIPGRRTAAPNPRQ